MRRYGKIKIVPKALQVLTLKGSNTRTSALRIMNIVFIHGLASSRRFFHSLEKDLKTNENVKTLSFDLPGFGKNKDWDGKFNLEEYLNYISEKIKEKFKDEQIVLIGHSFGGFLSIIWASSHTEQVSKIVLMNTPISKNEKEMAEMFEQDKKGWAFWIDKHPGTSKLLCLFLCQMGFMHLLKFLKPNYIPKEAFLDYTKHTWKSISQTVEILKKYPSFVFLEKIKNIPILHIVGLEECDLMKRHVDGENITRKEIKSGHFSIFEKKEETTKVIRDFLHN